MDSVGDVVLRHRFPDNDGSNGYQKDFVDETCSTTAVTLTLCPSTPNSDYTS